ncbi:MAG TPA: 23S rRNA (uracil(1939)-C(5))-methyltransferase RlmD [Gammaproteobacteria bacterium]|nr:23S rRNA (uracil(1939)-C(5))-methyltransferase RlmD [Gammaproteobacteria bacterium]
MSRAGPAGAPEVADIVAMTHDGRGIARVSGKTVFVDGALEGESVSLVRTRRRRNFDEARLERVLVNAPERVTPRCAYFGTCGGCTLQHVTRARQLELKQRVLLDSLERIGGVRPAGVLEPLSGPSWGYRRRARLGVRDVPGKGRVLVGFRERAKPYVADMLRCEVLVPPFGGLVEPLSALIGALDIRRQVPQIEIAAGDTRSALVLRVLVAPSAADIETLRGFSAAHGLDLYLQTGGPGTVRPLDGDAVALEYTLPRFGLTLAFEPTDFVQVNAALNRALVGRVVDLLAPGRGDRVLDLFCGLGNFTLPLSLGAAHVTGVDGDRGLIARARANAARNGIGNARFVTADLFDPSAACLREPADLVLLDPPRAGAAEAVAAGAGRGARRIVYVSCHPASLARDAGVLVRDHGFTLTAAGIADMFPHTAHVESVAVFDARR